MKRKKRKKRVSRRKYQQAYYQTHKAEFAERARLWRKANPEKALECTRRWQKANPEKVRAAKAKRYRWIKKAFAYYKAAIKAGKVKS